MGESQDQSECRSPQCDDSVAVEDCVIELELDIQLCLGAPNRANTPGISTILLEPIPCGCVISRIVVHNP